SRKTGSPARRKTRTSFSSRPKAMSERETSFATTKSIPFPSSLARAFVSRSSVSAANPTLTAPGAIRESPARMSSVGSRSSRGTPAAFLSLRAATSRGRKSATAAARITRCALGDRAGHLGSGFDVDPLDAARRGQTDRAGDEDRPRAPPSGLAREGESHLAARAVAQEADGIDRLVRRAGADENGAARELSPPEGREEGGGDRLRLRHPSHSRLARGERSFDRSDEDRAPGRERRGVALDRGLGPHLRVHRGRQDDRALEGERGGGQEVVGEAEGEAPQDVRCRGRDA